MLTSCFHRRFMAAVGKFAFAAALLVGMVARGQIAPATSGLPSNSLITSINAGVTLSPSTVSTFSTFNVGPLNGVTFDSSHRFANNSGGTTPWITISFNFNSSSLTTGNYFLGFIVTNKTDSAYASGLAIDAISGALTQDFESGTLSSISWPLQGSGATRGTISSSVTGLSASTGSKFAFIDTNAAVGSGTIGTTAIGGTNGTVLTSPSFSLTSGSTLSINVAFLSNDGSPYLDFALVQLFHVGDVPLTNVPAATLFTAIAPTAIPEPAMTALIQASSCALLVWYWTRRRNQRHSSGA